MDTKRKLYQQLFRHPEVYMHLYYNAFQPGSDMDTRLQNIADQTVEWSLLTGKAE